MQDYPPSRGFEDLSSRLISGVEEKVFPCGVLAVVRDREVLAFEAAGSYGTPAGSVPVSRDSIFDLASLTKVVSTWLIVGRLQHRGLLALDDTVDTILPGLPSPFAAQTTVRMLMTYTAGLPRETRLDRYGSTDRRTILSHILAAPLEEPVDSKVNYSNRHMIVLGEAVAAAAGKPLNEAAAAVWSDAGMSDTTFNPPGAEMDRVVSTELDVESGQFLRGVVHDENARLLGGFAGHAGAFSTAADLLRLAALILAEGRTESGETLIAPDFITTSLTDQTSRLGEFRGLIWDLATLGGRLVPLHHGFTGTSLVMVPESDASIVLLTNSVQFRREKGPLDIFRTALFEEIIGRLK